MVQYVNEHSCSECKHRVRCSYCKKLLKMAAGVIQVSASIQFLDSVPKGVFCSMCCFRSKIKEDFDLQEMEYDEDY